MADDKERSQTHQKRLSSKRQPLCASNSYSCHKLWLFLYILFHLLSGLALLAIGILVEIERREYSGLEKWLALPTAILIFIGLIVSINGLCGCVGTMEENVALIKLFFVISIITFICQISLAVLVYCFGQNVSHSKSKEVADQIFTQENYGKNYEIQQAVHRLQVKYSCCGMQSWHDYVDNLDTCRQRCAYTDAASGHACQYRCIFPESCCMDSKAPATSHTLSCSSEKVSEAPASMTTKPGCFGMFFDWLVGRLDLIGGTVFGLALPQVAGLVWTFLVLRKIKEYQSWYTVELTNENEML